MITRRMPAARAYAPITKSFGWFTPLVLAVACSGSEDIDFFEPSDETGGSATGGTSGASGSDTGGSSLGGTSAGGASGNGGTGAEATGGTGADTGGTGAEGGTTTGGTATGGDAGGGSGPTGGTGGDAMGGSAGKATGGTDTGGAGVGGAGMSGAGMGGAGMGGAGTGGAGTGGAGRGGGGMGGGAGKGGCVPSVPSTERCDGIDNNCSGAVDEGTACPDNCSGATYGGHAYMFCSFENASGTGTRERTWTASQTFCQTRGFDLVFIESSEENAYLVDWIQRTGLEEPVWMGANDRDPTLGLTNEGTWVWGSTNNAVQFWDGDQDGEPVMNRFSDWADGEPNNSGNEDCGLLAPEFEFQWDDRACSDALPNFVCESSASITTN
jgi:hypothetical protein